MNDSLPPASLMFMARPLNLNWIMIQQEKVMHTLLLCMSPCLNQSMFETGLKPGGSRPEGEHYRQYLFLTLCCYITITDVAFNFFILHMLYQHMTRFSLLIVWDIFYG